MSKKAYTNKQQKHIRSKGRSVFLPKRKTIFHKSDKDYDRKQNKEVIDIEIELSELEELEYDGTGRTDSKYEG